MWHASSHLDCTNLTPLIKFSPPTLAEGVVVSPEAIEKFKDYKKYCKPLNQQQKILEMGEYTLDTIEYSRYVCIAANLAKTATQIKKLHSSTGHTYIVLVVDGLLSSCSLQQSLDRLQSSRFHCQVEWSGSSLCNIKYLCA